MQEIEVECPINVSLSWVISIILPLTREEKHARVIRTILNTKHIPNILCFVNKKVKMP